MPTLEIETASEPPRTYTWRAGSIGIGRHPQNHVALAADTVSRWHAAIFADATGRFRLRDLGSRQGVRVGGRRVHDRVLVTGDAIQVGDFKLTFDEKESGPDTAFIPVDEELFATETLRPRELAAEPSWLARPVKGSDGGASVAKLVESMRDIGTHLDTDDMLSALLDRVDAVASSSECFVALVREDASLDVRARRSSTTAGGPAPLPLSQTLLRRAVESRRPLFVAQIAPHSDLASASVRSLGIVAATCVPLLAGGRVAGILHADWRQDRPAPSEAHLEWIAALALHGSASFEKCLLHARLRGERDQLSQAQGLSSEIVGISRAVRELADIVDRCAGASVDVLVTGETGTGKELVARRIHERSRRRDGPFVAVNCAAIPTDLFESELFGHVKGAFTNAVASRLGRLEEAAGGTIFLDEIGEMSLAHQAKLLRVLEERRVAPVGGAPRDLDVRVIAATNRDLPRAAAEGRVREDLWRRLGVPIAVPPLRERREDIPMLAYALLDRLGASFGRPVKRIAPATMDALVAHAWPGNVRELASCLRNALLFCEDSVEPAHLRLTPEVMGDSDGALPSLASNEKEHLARVLRATSGNQSRAAKILGVTENTVKAMMERHGFDRADFAG